MVDGYLPIEDHGVIGNLRIAALVGLDGAIEWWCVPGLAQPSVFASLLDHRRGGRFRVATVGAERGEQRYLEHTNVLCTVFAGDEGRLVVTDFMPLSGSIEGVCPDSTSEPAVYRILDAEDGPVDVEVEWSPRFAYGAASTQIMHTDGGFLAWAADDTLALAGVLDGAEVVPDERGQPVVRCTMRLEAGERIALVTRWGDDTTVVDAVAAAEMLDATVDSWCSWVHKAAASGDRAWAAPHEELVIRSELVLKLLSHAETGAIAAAVTTSLPEEIGGVRNWDYRYSWIRDSALVAQALFALGHRDEARAFIDWAERSAQSPSGSGTDLQIVHGMHGEREMPELEVTGLEGYRRSSPVRVGNGAVDQLQLDIYGELINAAYELVHHGEVLPAAVAEFLPGVADEACQKWKQRDYGLWEMRNGPMHFVYSKVMIWVALDRAVRLHDMGVIDGDAATWRQNRTDVRNEVLDRGFDPELGAFKQSYERSELDASNILLPLLEFLPFDDARVVSTLDATLDGLTDNGLVRRYVTDDGIAGGEGGFGLCTFWMVDALALSGRVDEASAMYEAMLARANHLGLYAEQIDPRTGAFLGNFPQAFTHLGLINSALYLAHMAGRDTPVSAPIGSSAHRSASDDDEGERE